MYIMNVYRAAAPVGSHPAQAYNGLVDDALLRCQPRPHLIGQKASLRRSQLGSRLQHLHLLPSNPRHALAALGSIKNGGDAQRGFSRYRVAEGHSDAVAHVTERCTIEGKALMLASQLLGLCWSSYKGPLCKHTRHGCLWRMRR